MLTRILPKNIRNTLASNFGQNLKYSTTKILSNNNATRNFSNKSGTPSVFTHRNNNYMLKNQDKNMVAKNNPQREKRTFFKDKAYEQKGYDIKVLEYKELSSSFRDRYALRISQISATDELPMKELEEYADILEQLNMKMFDVFMTIKSSIKFNQKTKKSDFSIKHTENYEQFIMANQFETMTNNILVAEFTFHSNLLKTLLSNIYHHIFDKESTEYKHAIIHKTIKSISSSFAKIKFFEIFCKTSSSCEFLIKYSEFIIKLAKVCDSNYTEKNKKSKQFDVSMNRIVCAFTMNVPIYVYQFEHHNRNDKEKFGELKNISKILSDTFIEILPNIKNLSGMPSIWCTKMHVQIISVYCDLRYEDKLMDLAIKEIDVEVKTLNTFLDKIDQQYINTEANDEKFQEFENETKQFLDNNLIIMAEIINKSNKASRKIRPLVDLLNKFFLKQLWQISEKMNYNIRFRVISQSLWHYMKVLPELNLDYQSYEFYKSNVKKYYQNLSTDAFEEADSQSLSMTVKALVSINFYDDSLSEKSFKLFYEQIINTLDDNQRNADLLFSNIISFIGTSLVGGYKIGNFFIIIQQI